MEHDRIQRDRHDGGAAAAGPLFDPARGKTALRSRRRRSRITPSAHSCIDRIRFSPFSVRTGKTRSFDRLSDALDERTISKRLTDSLV